ncbi:MULTISPECIES: (2Fe-2S)-binding protein [unclassified Candidatus Frackibacter]|uniref:(2Fe-2S)-binding protein n=1 Tax=unclassified Candidatus Frackibacter TaxID=2648818 RepID=UPI0008852CED|nr:MULTISPECIES: (2Fe-2S)-binding protein [unclassified Candidatus Frackibacter]SDC62517.1 BFD-like [2Fe-2S] binding domain-containing protein [Candidatus Frackibacter sp. WG11]SEM76273.1 BFD-like [2Fe-2S] binding domain-containing protein [Candidatus Frackibacter sp. WG12]SFL86237.1 BFD-like [2Fe-2S] binding domain-containing protein [Candidatus Frackibacter sp. WG13]
MRNKSCPQCNEVGSEVDHIAVDSIVKAEVNDDGYLVCLNEDCKVVYFNELNSYDISDLTVQVYFKSASDEECPICYCSDLTRKEIKEAVAKGYETIGQIREYTGKKSTGNCKTKNPLGKCCHKIFQNEINKYKNSKKSK